MKKTTSLIIISIIAAIFYPLSPSASEKKIILASIPPIASLAKMIVGDLADVESVQNKSACPHHYSLKPSDADKINKANYIILVDKSFEASFFKAAKNSKATKIELSKSATLNVKNNNLHIWLGIDNAKIILNELRNIFISSGFDKDIINSNYNLAISKISDVKTPTISENEIVIIGENLRYLLNENNYKKLYFFPRISSLKKLSELEKILKTKRPRCVIYDEGTKIDQLNYNKSSDFIELNAENWGEIGDYKEYYLKYLQNIYSRIKHCSILMAR